MTIQIKDIKYFNRLIKIIEKKFIISNIYPSRYLLSAIIMDKNKFVIGFNDYNKTHPATIQLKKTTVSKHAEIDAMSRWNNNWDTHNCSMYICGVTTIGDFCISSKPCNACLIKLKKFGLKRIIYSTYSNKIFSLNELII